MDHTDECFLDVPEPPPGPPGQPVPLDLEYGTPGWKRKRRLHRLARLNGACPECDGGPEEPTVQEFLRGLARPRPMKPDEVPVDGGLLTPEGEVASFVHGTPEVEDREAFTRWARSALIPVGQAFAHVASVDGVPWLRALLWFADDDRLHVEASSLDRYFHVEVTLEYLWPPVYRGSRT
ncbi:hypothetical protein, partial [Salsipaludibacter albus]|uniref:hypothetical protein n=1 Tax=Salsipaludibacter albus TaxID=2849650 RepID=UPI001EE43D64